MVAVRHRHELNRIPLVSGAALVSLAQLQRDDAVFQAVDQDLTDAERKELDRRGAAVPVRLLVTSGHPDSCRDGVASEATPISFDQIDDASQRDHTHESRRCPDPSGRSSGNRFRAADHKAS